MKKFVLLDVHQRNCEIIIRDGDATAVINPAK